jgi:SAM-dependent methyltransferase
VSTAALPVPAPYLAKVRRGERPTPEEALDFLRAWHASHPATTARSVSPRRFADGRSSYELLAACVPAGSDATVIDLACGDGLLASLLAARLGAGARILGVDASEEDLACARARGCPSRVRFARELASAMSPAPASVDAVLCHWALMLFAPLEPVIEEIARVLVPGGTFAAVVPSMWSLHNLSPELQAVVDELRAADLPGFPDLGLGDRRLATEGPQAFFRHEAGFEEPVVVTTHTATSRWDVATLVASFRDVYWFDLLREESQARILAEAARLLEPMPEPVEVQTEMRLIVARRLPSS